MDYTDLYNAIKMKTQATGASLNNLVSEETLYYVSR